MTPMKNHACTAVPLPFIVDHGIAVPILKFESAIDIRATMDPPGEYYHQVQSPPQAPKQSNHFGDGSNFYNDPNHLHNESSDSNDGKDYAISPTDATHFKDTIAHLNTTISSSTASSSRHYAPAATKNVDFVSTSSTGHLLDPPSSSIDPTVFDVSKKFDLKPHLDMYIHSYAKLTGFIILDDRKDYFSKEAHKKAGFSLPFKRIPRRGYFKCSPRSANRCKDFLCPFQVNYGWDLKKNEFCFNSEGTVLSHNHDLMSQMLTMDGKVQVNYADFLTFEEAEFIKEMATMRTDISMMGINLEERFPGRCFDRKLLINLKRKHVSAKFGLDGHNLQDLFQKGELIRQLGGKFVVTPSSSDLGIASIHSQSKLQRQYANI